MRRRSFLVAAGAAAIPWRRGAAQTSLGTLVWVEAGALWIRQLPDGHAAKIATATGLHAPRFSPSGRWISYQDHDDKLAVVRNDGQAGASIDSDGGAWFPQEDKLAVNREDDVVVYSAQTAWKAAAPFMKSAGLPVFSPDAKQFVFARENGLFLAGLTGGRPQQLTANPDGDLKPYAWAPDGKTIVYWSSEVRSASIWSDGVRLFAISKSGGPPRNLGVTTLVDLDFLDLAPATTGNRLALTTGGGRETWAGKRIAIADLDTGTVRQATDEKIAAFSPAWSPDGRSIVYSAGPDANAAYMKQMTGVNIKVMRPDGTVETKPIGPGLKIGVSGGEEAHVYLQQRKLWILDANGTGAPRQLTSDAHYRDEMPMWSADGEHLLFGRMDYEGHTSLWMMESSGDNLKQICKLQMFDPLGGEDSWFGFYGYTDWRDGFDWRRR